jgi:hypothetical protein
MLGFWFSTCSDGLLELNAYRCASAEDAQRALVVARQKILALSDADFDESALKLGKSLSVNATLCGLETHTDAAEGEMRELYRGYSVRELLEGYSRVDLLEFRFGVCFNLERSVTIV